MKKRIIGLFTIACIFVLLLPTLSVRAGDTSSFGKYNTISIGSSHSAAIKSDGSLWTWGINCNGQLGDGTTEDRYTPKKIMDDVIAVSVEFYNSAAIKSDGSLWTWGANYNWQLGDGIVADHRYMPEKIMDDVVAVSVGSSHSAAIKSDGSLWTWGDNYDGQLGDGTTEDQYTPKKIMDDVIAVSVGSDYSAAMKSDGSLWMWGDNYHGQLGDGTTESRYTPEKIMDNVIAVSAGSCYTAAIKSDGSLWTWGLNRCGQLGDGTRENRYVPEKIMDGVTAVSACFGHTAAIKSDGSLWTWGSNDYGNSTYGQLGDGTTEDRYTPEKIMDDVIAISGGTAAIKSDGSLWVWGSNTYGQLGDGIMEYSCVPIKIMDNVKLTGETSSTIVETPTTPITEPEPATPNTVTTSFGATVSDWAAPEIELAYENNLIPEVMVDFDLTQKVNRGEFAAIALQLYDVLANTETTLPASCPFTDIAGDVNEIAIKKASSLDITNGTSATTFEPVSFITREQLATMLCRVIKKYGFEGWTLATDSDYYMNTDGAVLFADDADISDWAKPSVYYMSLHGIIKGIDETHFAPKNTTTQQEASGYASATREQAIILAQRIFTKSDMLGNLN